MYTKWPQSLGQSQNLIPGFFYLTIYFVHSHLWALSLLFCTSPTSPPFLEWSFKGLFFFFFVIFRTILSSHKYIKLIAFSSAIPKQFLYTSFSIHLLFLWVSVYITFYHYCIQIHTTQGLYIVDDKHLWIELKLKSDNRLDT